MSTDISQEELQTLSPREQLWQHHGSQLTKEGIATTEEARQACLVYYRRAVTDFVAGVEQVHANGVPYITGSALEGLKNVGICPRLATFEQVRDWNHAKGADKFQHRMWTSDPDPDSLRLVEHANQERVRIVEAHNFPSDIDVVVMEEGTRQALSDNSLIQFSRDIFRQYGVYIEVHPQLIERYDIDPVRRIGKEFDISTLNARK